MSELKSRSCEEFVELLASKAPVPGGGGASALVGALAVALGNMVASLTIGKPQYADRQDAIIDLKRRADSLQRSLLDLIDKDAEVFEPLAKAYGLPKETEEERAYKAQVMQDCLREACACPLEIMERCCEAIDLHEEFAQKGAAIAISDVGVGVAFAKAALQGASLNVLINTKAMADKDYAERLNAQVKTMLATFLLKADAVYNDVEKRLA